MDVCCLAFLVKEKPLTPCSRAAQSCLPLPASLRPCAPGGQGTLSHGVRAPFSTEQMFNVLEGKRVNRMDRLLWPEPGELPGASHPSDPLRGHHCHPERPAATQVLGFPPCPLFPSSFLRAKEEAPHTVAHSDRFSII